MKNFNINKNYRKILAKGAKLIRKFDLVKINDQLDIDGPIIYAVNHSSMHDTLVSIEYLETQFKLLAGKENLDLLARILFKLNGVVYVDRKNKESRKNVKEELIKQLENGKNVLMFPEGTWNLTENKIMLPLNWGIIEIAQKTGATIVPVILEYTKDACYTKTGNPFKVSKTDNKTEKINQLTDELATLRWDIWESLGVEKRENVNKEQFDSYIKMRLDEYPSLDREFEESVIFGKKEDPFDFINNLEVKKETAHLFRKQK